MQATDAHARKDDAAASNDVESRKDGGEGMIAVAPADTSTTPSLSNDGGSRDMSGDSTTATTATAAVTAPTPTTTTTGSGSDGGGTDGSSGSDGGGTTTTGSGDGSHS